MRKSLFSFSSTCGPCCRIPCNQNSFTIPYHIFFLKPPRSLSYALPAQGTIHSRQLLDVLLICTHQPQLHIEITCNVEVTWHQLWRPSRSTFVTLEMQASYISKLLLESRAYTAITIVAPKRIAVHFSSNFHDI